MRGSIGVTIVAVGGQGNILAARLLGESALACGLDVRMSEFHGMAQRGGVVESMVVLGEGESYSIADGETDILLGFEPSETIRAAQKCGSGTLVITNTAPVPPFTVALGKARYPDIIPALALLEARVTRVIALDATQLARQAGSALSLNIVMLGALAGSGVLGFPNEAAFETAIVEKTKPEWTGTNLKAFRLGVLATSALRR